MHVINIRDGTMSSQASQVSYVSHFVVYKTAKDGMKMSRGDSAPENMTRQLAKNKSSSGGSRLDRMSKDTLQAYGATVLTHHIASHLSDESSQRVCTTCKCILDFKAGTNATHRQCPSCLTVRETEMAETGLGFTSQAYMLLLNSLNIKTNLKVNKQPQMDPITETETIFTLEDQEHENNND